MDDKSNLDLTRLLQGNRWYQFFYYSGKCNRPKSAGDSQLHIRKRVVVEQANESTFVKVSDLNINRESTDKIVIPRPYVEYESLNNRQVDHCTKVTYPIFVRTRKVSNGSEFTELYANNDTPTLTPSHSKIGPQELSFPKKSSKKSSRFDVETPYSTFDVCPHSTDKINVVLNKNPNLLLFTEAEDETIKNIVLAAIELKIETKRFDKVKQIENLHQPSANIIIIDVRTMRVIPKEVHVLCDSNRRCVQETIILALVKREDFERNNLKIAHLIDIGFTRCLVENCSYVACYNDLYMTINTDLLISKKAYTFNALFSAVSLNTSDLILVLDNEHNIIHCSPSIKEHLQYEVEDVLGDNVRNRLLPNPSTFERVLTQGSSWRGTLQMTNKNQETVAAQCNLCTLFDDDDHRSYVVMSLYVYGPLREKKVSLGTRQSAFVLMNIVQAIGLVEQARDKCERDGDAYRMLSNVVELLDNVNVVKTVKMIEQISEPVASDLITALLDTKSTSRMGVEKRDSRRRTVSKIFSEEHENFLSWDYDVLSKECSRAQVLVSLGMEIFDYFNVARTLNCSESVLANWLIVMANNYHKDVPYHNSTHAADVMQACAVFLTNRQLRLFTEPNLEAACLISAVAHDLDHQGRSSAFLCNSNHRWALLYNDLTVLENHHVSLMFHLTLSDDRINIFKNVDIEQYKAIRSNIIDLILSTDMTKHFDILTKFVNEFSTIPFDTEDVFNAMNSPEKIILIYRMIIKCADVSNPTRSFKLALEWCRRITEEYCAQTDEEKILSLPVVMPMFDRETCSVPKAQIGFIEYIINDMFEAWSAFIDMPELLRNMRKNYKIWKQLDELGFDTLATLSEDIIMNDDVLSVRTN